MNKLAFEVGKKLTETNYHIFSVDTYEKKAPDGKIGAFVKLNAPDWVGAVISIEGSDKFVLVNEYRHGVDKVVTQFPCGTVEEGETAEEALLRELKEEIGLDEDNIVSVEELFTGNPNPAFMNNKITFFDVKIKQAEFGKTSNDAMEFVEKKVCTTEEVCDIMSEDDAAISQQLAWFLAKLVAEDIPLVNK